MTSASPRRTIFRNAMLATASAVMLLTIPACSEKIDSLLEKVGFASEAEVKEVRVTAETFRINAAMDLYKGLELFGQPKANLRFVELGKDMFPGMDAELNWQLFFTTALTLVVRSEGDAPVIGYYHPWSDVLLITSWQKAGDELRITSVDVMPGSIMRGAKPPYSLAREWQSGETYAPQAVGDLTVATTKAFEAAYSEGGKDPLTSLDTDVRLALADMAAIPFRSFGVELAEMSEMVSAQKPMAKHWQQVFDDAEAGSTKFTGRAGDGIKALANLDKQTLRTFNPVSYISGNTAEVLILANRLEPSLFLVLRATLADGRSTLDRVDIVNFQYFFAAAEQEAS